MQGTEGAVDRITQEILVSLDERPTLVVWLLDQSESIRPQRTAIEKRFDHIYKELDVIQSRGQDAFTKHGNQPLLTAVVAFGQEISFRTKDPTDDLAEIKKAIHEIPVDESGVELTFTAVAESARKYQKFRTGSPRRNVMLIVVTDEAGNDEDRLEPAIELCKRHAMPVYVIGVPAPFGQRQAFVKYVDRDPQIRAAGSSGRPGARVGNARKRAAGILRPRLGPAHGDRLRFWTVRAHPIVCGDTWHLLRGPSEPTVGGGPRE